MTEPTDHVTADASTIKATLRRDALAARDALSVVERRAGAEALAAFADDLGAAAGTVVAGYLPIRSEIDPRPLMAALSARGAILALPAVRDDGLTLEFRHWRFGGALESAAFGLSVPPPGTDLVDPVLILMPLAAFDAAGRRIGWGKGHYDRALEGLEATGPRRKIGLAFAVQQVDRVPDAAHDRRLDLVLTERGPVRPKDFPS
ncbi:5-formyltetrahydrofolate cyclo-ligase [Siculibacillus lacustris]|uniref:5-formyltetrahydrofolate cyclo-ligase n=1 Tax=Siculibacillus lacustris TaxID=1549641 RepID=UPI001D188A20|nr:5-formyltetrahydrofolate cyclo-ligase [Siculibacillus lacustris]